MLRVEDSETLLHFISIFGVSAVVGVRKRPPKVVRLRANDTKSSVDLIFFPDQSCLKISV